MKAAVEAVRAHAPVRIVVAVPVGSPEICQEFAAVADKIVCARAPAIERGRRVCVSNCQFSRRIEDWATLRGARYLPYADAHP
jgi:hypothetical protein